MPALLLTFLLLLVALLWYEFQCRPSPVRTFYEPYWLVRARHRFWLTLYSRLAGRTRRIWRYCRRHYGWGIEILYDAQFLLSQLL